MATLPRDMGRARLQCIVKGSMGHGKSATVFNQRSSAFKIIDFNFWQCVTERLNGASLTRLQQISVRLRNGRVRARAVSCRTPKPLAAEEHTATVRSVTWALEVKVRPCGWKAKSSDCASRAGPRSMRSRYRMGAAAKLPARWAGPRTRHAWGCGEAPSQTL